ncbi:RHS repeat-associated core domain-containing protein [Orenia marismortui]|uniref:RHS repeat-associated protein n=1 Tax=Orenia marismortui TaxID=46469 RepID=A0A4R8H8J0_9FIRM|nr:RHS repeat-associated core domain-containing protein [Orenia marismortui]TDX51147.1 RHS repeat-associated protein [Orenia marismortui]
MNNRKSRLLIGMMVVVLLLSFSVIGQAYNKPWDQGHNGTNLDDEGPSSPGDKATDKNNECKNGDPVDLYTGNFDYDTVDFQVASRGINMIFQRSYNAVDYYDGPFGPGWNFSYNIRLIEIPKKSYRIEGENGEVRIVIIPKKVIIRQGNSDRLTFIKGEDSYSCLSNEFQGSLEEEINGSYILRQKSGLYQVFSSEGVIKEETDRNGNKISFRYDGSGRLTSINDTVGRVYSLIYNSSGKVSRIIIPGNQRFRYNYDRQGRLTEFVEPNGATTRYTYKGDTRLLTKIIDPARVTRVENHYDEQDRVLKQFYDGGNFEFNYSGDDYREVTDRKGNISKYWLDDGGRPLKKQDSLNNRIQYSYNGAGKVSSITNPKGATTKFQYDDNQNLVKIINPLEQSIGIEYNKFGEPTSQSDLTGDKQIEYIYDEDGNISKVKTAAGVSSDYETNEYGQVIKVTNNNGESYQFEYDQYGYLDAVIDPLGNRSEYQYDALGRLTSQTDAKGNVTTYEYGYYGVTKVRDAKGNETKYEYDNKGNLIKVTDALGNSTEYQYNDWDNLVKIVDALGNTVVSYSYDANENLKQVTDAKGNTTTYHYDELDRVIKVVDAVGNKVEYGYDAVGNMIEFSDTKDNSYSYDYDKLGRLIKEVDPLNHQKTYSYNEEGLLDLVNEPDGDVIDYDYDDFNRLTQVDYSGELSKSYSYDNLGRTASISRGMDSISFAYNSLGQVKEIIDMMGRKLSYSYDAVGNRIGLTLPNSKSFVYAYNQLNRLTAITAPNGDQFGYEYDAIGRRTKLSYPNGKVASYDYDALGRLTELNNGINSYSYNYDQVSNIKSIVSSTGRTNYNYDKLNRLTGVTYSDGENIYYSYDAMGNRTRMTTAQGTTSYSYNQLNQLVSAGSINYQYDAEGKLIQKTDGSETFTYSYNAYDRLAQVTKNNTELASYAYDPMGRRVSVTEDGQQRDYLWDGNSLLATYIGTSMENLYAVGSGIDEVLGVYGNQTKYLHSNHLGSITGITGTDGSVLGARSYTPYGMVRSTTGTFNSKLGFIGRSQSSTTGLTYIRARYYDASVGRFTRVDPVRDGLNWYGYAGGNPVNYYDPYGLFSMSCPIVQSALERLAMTWGAAFAEPTFLGEIAAIGISGGIIINGAWDIYTYNKDKSGEGEDKNKGYDPDKGALDQLGKELEHDYKKKGKVISKEEADIIDDWCEEYDVPQHHDSNYPNSGDHWKEGKDHTHIRRRHIPYE